MLDADALECRRLDALDRYDVLDTPPEEAFDRVTRLVRRLMNVSISTISLLDGHRQWFKSRQGLALAETARRPAFCNVAIRAAAPLVVPDTLEDERFRDNPFVVGPPHIRFYAGIPLRSPDGSIIGTLCAIHDEPRLPSPDDIGAMSDLARIVMTELELRTLATTDALTGAMSRRAFRMEGERAVALARRHGHELSCIAIDLDHFKAVNDTHGHAVGDSVLVETVATLRARLRTSDLVGRLGGEEFAVLLPHAGATAAAEIAEKLRAAIAKSVVGTPSGPLSRTASFGIADLDGSVDGIDELLRRADAALYAAKAGGRNRCAPWTSCGKPNLDARSRVLRSGMIAFDGRRSTVDCTVRSLSKTGAALAVLGATDLPSEFELRIRGGRYRSCRTVGGGAGQGLEVEFA